MQKSEKEINSEIAAIIRQITASVTFLPLITDPCTFDLLVYTAAEADVPASWCAYRWSISRGKLLITLIEYFEYLTAFNALGMGQGGVRSALCEQLGGDAYALLHNEGAQSWYKRKLREDKARRAITCTILECTSKVLS